ncbi:hypothetical protein LWI28_012456 [Acer negundo]|uniref:Uncharacterized protein n=1 Tax=Acer negundo TaxID=4023 RepID=A0AAD5NXV4_ACENE|nr:hypothetical protein LWI28_012456 [Acer negundo]
MVNQVRPMVSTILPRSYSGPGHMARQQVRFHEVSGNQSSEKAVVSSASNVNVDQSSLQDGSGFSCSLVVDLRVQIQSSSPWFLVFTQSSLGLRLVGMNDRGGLISTIWVFTYVSFPEVQIVHYQDQHLTVSLSIGSRVH